MVQYNSNIWIRIMVIDLNHVLFLPDGNRRYAMKAKITYRESYDMYFSRILEIAKYILLEKDVRELTIAVLYNYNFTEYPKRLAIDDVFDAAEIGLPAIAEDNSLAENKVNVRIHGELDDFAQHLPKFGKIFEGCKKERGGEKVLNLLFSYSGQKELERIIKKLQEEGNSSPKYSDIIERMFSKNLIGLIITCGQVNYEGQPYTYSNTCMPFLNAYNGRFATIEKLLPEIHLDEIGLAIDGYRKMREIVKVRTYTEDPRKEFNFV